MENYKIKITIEKENELNKILDEIINLKNEEQKLDDIYKNMVKKIERIKKKIYILENKKEDLEENLYDIKV